MMADKDYWLEGFEPFLNHRRVVFVEPLPSSRVCSVCEVVSSRSWLLSCRHVVCRVCKVNIETVRKCPLDGEKLDEELMVSLEFDPDQLDRYPARCLTGGRKCGFVGRTSELSEHMAQCTVQEVKCKKCNRYIARNAMLFHCACCSVGVSTSPSLIAIEEAPSQRGEIKRRREESSEKLHGDFFNSDTGSATEHQWDFRHGQGEGVSTRSESGAPGPNKSSASTPGPSRYAS